MIRTATRSSYFRPRIESERVGPSACTDGPRRFREMVSHAHFHSADGAVAFAEDLLKTLVMGGKTNSPTPVDLASMLRQPRSVEALYDLLFGLDYIHPGLPAIAQTTSRCPSCPPASVASGESALANVDRPARVDGAARRGPQPGRQSRSVGPKRLLPVALSRKEGSSHYRCRMR
jgi:hypothetical protein